MRTQLYSLSRSLLFLKFILCVLTSAEKVSQYFSEKPQNVSASEGSDAVLRCGIANQAQQGRTQWTKAGFALGFKYDIPGFKRYSVIGDHSRGEYHLKIEKVELADDGLFECQALPHINEAGIRSSAHLIVQVSPKNISLQGISTEKVLEVKSGTEINIPCRVSGGKPAASVTWSRNGHKVHNRHQDTEVFTEGNKLFTTVGRLKWKVQSDDNKALFTCQAHHPALRQFEDMRANFSLNVLYPPGLPTINGYEQGSVLIAGERIVLSCSVKNGNPAPEVSWYREDQLLSKDAHAGPDYIVNNYQFNVEPSDDQAEYICSVSSPLIASQLSEKVRLKVNYGPSEVKIDGMKQAKVGDTVDVECRSGISSPPARIEWIVDGRPLDFDQETLDVLSAPQGRGFISVSNIKVKVPDNRQYLELNCRAFNDAIHGPKGEASESFRMEVLRPPESIKVYGYEQDDLMEETKVKLTCVVTGGNPLAAIQWYRGSELIKEHPGSTHVNGRYSQSELTLRVNRKDNARIYSCRASNAASVTPLTANVTFSVLFASSKVSIRVTPEDGSSNTLQAGKVASLFCESGASNPAPAITWWRGEEKQISVDVHKKTVGKYGGWQVANRLYVPLTPEHNDATFDCHVVNKALDQSVTESVTLNVQYKPVFDIGNSHVITVLENETVEVNASAVGNPSLISFTWTKDGEMLERTLRTFSTSRVTTRGPMLKIGSVQRDDAGTYVCEASNSEGTSNLSVNVVVKYPPEIKHVTPSLVVDVGGKAILKCEVRAFPMPGNFILWKRDDYDMSRVSIRSKDGTSVLTIDNVKVDDTGEFACTADNGLGSSVQRTSVLLVKHPPVISRPYTMELGAKFAASPGEDVILSCNANGVPKVEILWRKPDGPVIQESSKYSSSEDETGFSTYKSQLRIRRLTEADYGNYACIARNAKGTDTMRVQLLKPSKPDAPVYIKALNVSSDSILLSWKPGFHGGKDQAFKIRYREKGHKAVFTYETPKNVEEFEVRSLKAKTEYLFSIAGVNSLGLSEWTRHDQSNEPLVVTTQGAQSKNKIDASPIWEVVLGFLAAAIILLIFKVICLIYCIRKRRKKKLKETAVTRRLVSPNLSQSPRSHLAVPASSYAGNQGEGSNCTESSENDNFERGEMSEEEDGSVRTVIELDAAGRPVMIERVTKTGHHAYIPDATDRSTLPRLNFANGVPNSPNYAEAIRANSLQRRIAAGAYHAQQPHPQHDAHVSFAPQNRGEKMGEVMVPPPMGPLRSFSQELNTYAPSNYVHYHVAHKNGLIRRCSPESQSKSGSPTPGVTYPPVGIANIQRHHCSLPPGSPRAANYAEVRPILSSPQPGTPRAMHGPRPIPGHSGPNPSSNFGSRQNSPVLSTFMPHSEKMSPISDRVDYMPSRDDSVADIV